MKQPQTRILVIVFTVAFVLAASAPSAEAQLFPRLRSLLSSPAPARQPYPANQQPPQARQPIGGQPQVRPNVPLTIPPRGQTSAARPNGAQVPLRSAQSIDPQVRNPIVAAPAVPMNPNDEDLGRSVMVAPPSPGAFPTGSDSQGSDLQKNGSLGVDVEPFSDPVTGVQGVRVTKIGPQSLAGNSGLQVGDVIVGVDGQSTSSIPLIIASLSEKQPGETVVTRIVRDRRTGDLTIPLVDGTANRQVASAKPANPSDPSTEPTNDEPTNSQPMIAQPTPESPIPESPVPANDEPTLAGPALQGLPDNPTPAASPNQAAPQKASSVTKDPSVAPVPEMKAVEKINDEKVVSTAKTSSMIETSMIETLGFEVEDAKVVRGAVIKTITSESIGSRMGLETGDRIVSVGEDFVFTGEMLEVRLKQWDGVAPLKLQLIRNQRLLTLSLDPSASPSSDAESKSPADANKSASTSPPAGSMLSGLGSAIGGFLNKSNDKSSSNGNEGNTLSPPTKSSGPAVTSDPLAFGDEEEIGSVKLDTPTTPIERNLDDNREKTPSTASESENIEEEIRRLENKLKEMKAKSKKEK